MKHLVIKSNATIKLLNEVRGELLIQNPSKTWSTEEVIKVALETILSKIRGGV